MIINHFGTGEIVFVALSPVLISKGQDKTLPYRDQSGGWQPGWLGAGVHCVTRRDTRRAEFVQPYLRKDKGASCCHLQLCNLFGEDRVLCVEACNKRTRGSSWQGIVRNSGWRGRKMSPWEYLHTGAGVWGSCEVSSLGNAQRKRHRATYCSWSCIKWGFVELVDLPRFLPN